MKEFYNPAEQKRISHEFMKLAFLFDQLSTEGTLHKEYLKEKLLSVMNAVPIMAKIKD